MDESGNFDRQDDETVVGGILLRNEEAGADRERLQQALSDLAPDVPWPLHAAHYNLPVYLALVSYISGRATGDPEQTPHQHKALQAIEALRSSLNDDEYELAEQAIRALRREEKPNVGALRILDKQFRRLADYSYFRELVADVARALQSAVEALGREGQLLAVAGQALPPHLRPRDRDQRYAELLAAWIQRAVDLVERRDPRRHQVHLQVLERPYGAGRLTKANVLALARREVVSQHDVQLDVEVLEYAAGMHPALVLADFVSNRAYRQAGEASLSVLERKISLATGFISGSRTPPSWVAGSEPAHRFILRARTDGVAEALRVCPLASCRSWARQQAEEWGHALQTTLR